jgi:superfamily II DNA/RNA helicase
LYSFVVLCETNILSLINHFLDNFLHKKQKKKLLQCSGRNTVAACADSAPPFQDLNTAKDQADRESTVADFKSNVCSLLIATSVAARGLDVKELELVVNYDVPNHYEDYVHRVGRTGRAGRKGSAVTFISEEEERYAPDLVKALELSEQTVPVQRT